MAQPNEVLLALGSNLPWRGLKPRAILDAALEKLGAVGRIEARSGWWRTGAWPDSSDPPFLNIAARMRCGLEPAALLCAALEIEADFGRERGAPNAPRTLDIDILDFAGLTIDLTDERGRRLTLPHPRLAQRAFVLAPLLDVAPRWRDPVSGETASALFARLPGADRASVRRVGEADA